MADTIQIKAGNGSSNLADRELAYKRSEKALYIGTPEGNEKVGDANWETRIAELENKVVELETEIENLRKELANG